MDGPKRVTEPLLDVVELLLQAMRDNRELHGWAIMNETKRSGPTVYGVLDRLEDLDWITGTFEERNDHLGRPPRRFYRLTPHGAVEAERLLLDRRPHTVQRENHQSGPSTTRHRAATARPARGLGLAHLALRAVGLGNVR